MKKWLLLTIFPLLFSCSSLIRSPQQALISDFALLDKSFISALYLSRQGDPNAARKYFPVLRKQWKYIATKYKNELFDETGWINPGDKISIMITGLPQISSEDMHDELEDIQDLLTDLRGRNEIDYYLDYLFHFHTAMETFGNLVPLWINKSTTLVNLKNAGRTMESEWNKWKAQSVNPRIFSMNNEDYTKLQQQITNMDMIMSKMIPAINAGDQTQIPALMPDIKKTYISCLLLFSNLEKKK